MQKETLSYETKSSTVSLSEDGIIIVRMKKGARLELEVAQYDVSMLRSTFGTRKHSKLIDMRGTGYLSKAARRHYADSDTPDRFYAIALLVNSVFTKTMANLFINYAKPPIPNRLFTEEEEAMEWLGQFRATNVPANSAPLKTIQNARFTQTLIRPNIIRFAHTPGQKIDLAIAKEGFEQLVSLSPEPFYLCVHFNPIRSFTSEARSFLAKDDRVLRMVKARAIVATSSISKSLGYFFLKFNRPKVPTQIFGNEKSALKWLLDLQATEKNQKISATLETQAPRKNALLLENIQETLAAYAQKHFATKVPIPNREDPLIELASSINMLGEELEQALSKEALYQELSKELESHKATTKALRETQAQLIQASKLTSLGTMASGMCHELNNPLTAVVGFADILLSNTKLEGEDRRLLDEIRHSSLKMKTTIDHLRSFARESKEKDWQQLRLEAPINAAFDLLKTRLHNKGISFRIFCAPNCEIRGNHNLLESVFQNLIVNSEDAFSEVRVNQPKEIRIEVSLESNDRVLIRYEDTATGMTPDTLNKIFEPFFTTKDTGAGTGLGMSISHGIIEQHQGSIHVENSSLGGSIFLIRLPLAIAELQEQPILESDNPNELEPIKPIPEVKKKMLMVDDEPNICTLFKRFLHKDLDVETTTDPLLALELIAKNKYDLIVTDLKMPQISGTQIIEQAKVYQPNVPVLIISGHARTDEDVAEALAAGATDLLTKPFTDFAALKATCKNYAEHGTAL